VTSAPHRTSHLLAAGATILALGAAAAAGAIPPVGQPIPHDPVPLARALAGTTATLRAELSHWQASGHIAIGGPPRQVELLALYQERILILLAQKETLARATIARLPASVAAETTDEVVARRELGRLTTPRPMSAIRIGTALPAGILLRDYLEAQRRFGVAWQVLAAVNLVESAFGRLRNASLAGAQGPMQFLPSTWRAYGRGGDIDDPHDAILGAANYLHSAGAPHDYRGALFAYNHSAAYVDAVLRYARQIERDRRTFLAYYAWPVFVRTPAGLRRLTGPPGG
jgi:membrane-bound lytic murein transglycosylase B